MADANIAINRFGYGARADENPPADPKRWLIAQFDRYDARPPAIAATPGRAEVAGELVEYYEQQQAIRAANRNAGGPARRRRAPSAAMEPGAEMRPAGADAMTPASSMPDQAGTPMAAAQPQPDDPVATARRQARQAANQAGRQVYVAAVGARMTTALTTPAPFVERLVHFWANHFAVSAEKLGVVGLSGLLEFEAIRPNVLGKFTDMLLAVERHPAMLLYLDQTLSIGPNSLVGTNAALRNPNRKRGLNENLAREIMELHTLGVRSVYTQADVTEFARALTGWTVSGIGRGPGARFADRAEGAPGSFVFNDRVHEPGDRNIVGQRYAASGVGQGEAILRHLAAHPATAKHIATKLARHFAGDTPPPALVARLEQAFLKSSGDLPTVYRALVAAPEVWVEQPVKFKTPWEWSVSTMRALGYREAPPQPSVGLLNQLGQPVWKPGSPAGYDDVAGSWAGPDAVMRRVEAAERFASRAGPIDARALGPKLYPAALSATTQQQLARAESPGQALALLLVAPEAMRR